MKVISPLFAVAIAAAVFAPRVDADCAIPAVCTVGTNGCVEAKITAGATLDITAPGGGGCTLGNYLSLDIGGQTTDSIAVTFSDGITSTSSDTKDGTTLCKSTFKDVGKDAAVLTNVPKSVVATVKCNNPTADCKVTYLPSWTCQTRDNTLCPKECSDTTNCKTSTIANGANLVLTNPDTCPASKYSYLTSLMIGSRDKLAINVAFAATGATTAPSTTDSSGTCYSVYGQYPVAGQLAAQAADASATVTCPGAGADCKVQAYATWGCDAPKCSTVCGAGCTDAVIATGGSLTLTKPTTTCPVGTFAYPKGLTIGGKYAAHNLAVSFSNNFAPKPTASVADCYFSYPDLGASALTADVEVKVQCKDASKPCTAQYKVDSWECQSKTYTRTAMAGANCKAANDCVNRCGKSYKVNAKGTAGSFVPQLAADCKCTALTATMAADGKTATNADMTATFDATANTLVLDVTKTGALCKSTYAVSTFTSPFIPRSYIRQSMTPAACVKADDNTYKCDGDVVLAQSATDKITLTQTTPGAGGITCSGTIDAFLSDDAKTAADATTKIVYTPTATGMQVVTTNADASVCTAVYGGRCAKPCTGCTDQAIASGGSFVVKKPDDKTCPTGQFAYPKTLLVGGKDLSQVAVTFNNGLKPTPIDSSGDCFFSYGDVVGSSAVTSNVEATVKCKDPAVACTAQVKVGDWGCYSSVDATKTYMRTTMTGAKCGAVSDCVNRCGKSYAVSIKDGTASFLPQLAADCKCATLTATMAADLKTATNADMTATFDAAAKTLAFDVTKAGSECKTTYAVGTFANPFVTRSYIRQSMAPAACVKADDNTYKCDGDLALTQAAIDKITLTQATPGPGAITCSGTTDAFLSDNGNTATDATTKIVYTPTATGMQVVTTNADATTCTAVYAGRCAKPCVGCTDQAIAVGGSFVVKKAEDKTCPTGQFAYPKTLTVGGKDLSQVAVTFNNGLKPALSDSLNDCFFSYTDVVGSAAVTSNVEATVKCKDPAVACTAQVKVGDWGCYGPADAAKTYTRTAMTGANCVAKLSDCANRCGKSYALGVKDTFTTYVPQLAPDCNCPLLTATPAADAKSAANADAGLTVTYDTTASTMSLAFAKTGAVCTSTYKLAAFTNPFPVKTFTRQNVTPADCVAATDCGYRCDAEIALNKTQADTVAAVRTAVPSCTCKTTVTYVGDDRKAAGADDTATYVLESTDAGVSVSTTIGAKTCVAAYTEKIVTPAPTTPAPVTTTPAPTAKTGTGTSAGVSALGAGAGAGVTTVTLVAAAAGVQAIGLPV